MTQPCLFCGGETSAPDHDARCDGRQGHVEAEFNHAAGRAARDAALAQVEDAAAPAFLEAAEQALYRVARTAPMLTTDDVWRALGTEAHTHEPRAMGPVMMRGKANGWVEPTHTTTTSAMVRCHSRPKTIWRSLILERAS